MIAAGDVTVFQIRWRRGATRRLHTLFVRPVAVSVLIAASIGFAVLGAGSRGDVSKSSDLPKTIVRAKVEQILLPEPVITRSADPVSYQLRRPIRVIDRDARQHDLGQLISGALESFHYSAHGADRLTGLLLMTLSEGKTDQEIDSVLNTALSRGEFTAPEPLITRQYRFDTQKLLDAVLAQAAL